MFSPRKIIFNLLLSVSLFPEAVYGTHSIEEDEIPQHGSTPAVQNQIASEDLGQLCADDDAALQSEPNLLPCYEHSRERFYELFEFRNKNGAVYIRYKR